MPTRSTRPMRRRATGSADGTRHVALLRGINVGGKHPLPMAELARAFADHGCADVSTYIQSGNVLFRASAAVLANLADAVETAIRAQFGFDVPVVLRSLIELDTAVGHNPFLGSVAELEHLHIAFLRDTPTAAQIKALDPGRSSADAFRVIGSDVFLHLRNGVAGSKLTNAYFDRALATKSTIRGWRTVVELRRRLTG